MTDCGDWVAENHPRAGKPHHGPNLLPHVRLVAMHLAVGAEGLGLHKGAPVAALPGISIQGGAVGTEGLSTVFLPAI